MTKVLCGDVLEMLKTIPDNSIHCCVTSPPYWGLRDYKVPPSIWGGDPVCEHEFMTHVQPAANGIVHSEGMSGKTRSGRSATRKPKKSAFCSKCGAWKGCYGFEPTPDLYVEHTVMIFREIRRVLRPDGTVWVNIGDCYASGKGSCFNPGGGAKSHIHYDRLKEASALQLNRLNKSDLDNIGLKPKDLVGIPWRVAFALQADGWWLRQDIIWYKKNPMPESVRDRCTRSHEYIFMLSKSALYFYDPITIAEPAIYSDEAIWDNGLNGHGGGVSHVGQGSSTRKFAKPTGWAAHKGGHGAFHKNGREQSEPARERGHSRRHNGLSDLWDHMSREEQCSMMRNKRSVWEINAQPFKGAHFATFPQKLPELCIRAGTSEHGACAQCGAPWERVTESGGSVPTGHGTSKKAMDLVLEYRGETSLRSSCFATGEIQTKSTVGWRPTCRCGGFAVRSTHSKRLSKHSWYRARWQAKIDSAFPKVVACEVLDPFAGAGTTLDVAERLKRDSTGIELSEKYVKELIEPRLANINPLFKTVEPREKNTP